MSRGRNVEAPHDTIKKLFSYKIIINACQTCNLERNVSLYIKKLDKYYLLLFISIFVSVYFNTNLICFSFLKYKVLVTLELFDIEINNLKKVTVMESY